MSHYRLPSKLARNAHALFVPLMFTACGGQISGAGQPLSSSSSSSSSSTSATSSSTTSASSSSGFFRHITHRIDANKFCGSSTGELRTEGDDYDGVGFFAPTAYGESRVDIPGVKFDGGPYYEPPQLAIKYANGTGESIPMSLWFDGRPSREDVHFPPTGGWSNWQEVLLPNFGQVSLLALTPEGAPYVDSVHLEWKIDCSHISGCGWSDVTLRDCPAEDALPGVAQTSPAPPEAAFDIDYSTDVRPFKVTFDAGDTFDSNLEPLTFDWDFGDGTSASGVKITREMNYGVHFIRLTVTDPSGLTDSLQKRLILRSREEDNSEPIANIEASRTNVLRPNTGVTLDARRSADADGDNLTYTWHDSHTEEVWRGPVLELELQESSGISLWASDGRGGIGSSSVYLNVQDIPEGDCRFEFSDHPSYPRIFLSIYNLADRPINDWVSEWYVDAPEPITINSVSGATLSGEEPLRLSLPGGRPDLPAASWVFIVLPYETNSPIEEISFRPADGRNCTDERQTSGSSSSNSSSGAS